MQYEERKHLEDGAKSSFSINYDPLLPVRHPQYLDTFQGPWAFRRGSACHHSHGRRQREGVFLRDLTIRASKERLEMRERRSEGKRKPSIKEEKLEMVGEGRRDWQLREIKPDKEKGERKEKRMVKQR